MRPAARALLAIVSLAVAASCGSGKPAATPRPSPTPSPTPTPVNTVDVVPASGPVGTKFVFRAAGFKAGEKVTFEVEKPDGTKFTGPPHDVPATGPLEAPYTPSKPGDYQVLALGSGGERAEGKFTVTAGSGGRAATSPAHTATPTPTASG